MLPLAYVLKRNFNDSGQRVLIIVFVQIQTQSKKERKKERKNEGKMSFKMFYEVSSPVANMSKAEEGLSFSSLKVKYCLSLQTCLLRRATPK